MVSSDRLPSNVDENAMSGFVNFKSVYYFNLRFEFEMIEHRDFYEKN